MFITERLLILNFVEINFNITGLESVLIGSWVIFSAYSLYNYFTPNDDNNDDDERKKREKIIRRWFLVTAVTMVVFGIMHHIIDYDSYYNLIKDIENPITEVEKGHRNINYIDYYNLDKYTDEQIIEYGTLVPETENWEKINTELKRRGLA